MNVKERVETTGTNDERVSETAQTGGEVVGGKDGTLAPREEEEGSDTTVESKSELSTEEQLDASPSPPPLPAELIDMILDEVDRDEPTLAALCLVSSAFLNCFRPLLYDSFTLEFHEVSNFHDWMPDSRQEDFSTCCPSGSYEVVQTLLDDRYTHLPALVHHVSITTTLVESVAGAVELYGRGWRAANNLAADTFPKDEDELEDLVDEVLSWDVKSGYEVFSPLLRRLTSLRSLNIESESPAFALGSLINDLQHFARLGLLKLRGTISLRRCANSFWTFAPDGVRELPPLPAFPALQTVELEVWTDSWNGTDATEGLFKEWCEGRGIELRCRR